MVAALSYTTLPYFELLSPSTLDEALVLLNKYQNNCAVIAGGTDLLIELRLRLKKPKVLIDIKNIPELNRLELTTKGLFIGSSVPISKILELPYLKSNYNALYQALSDMCDEVLRKRATIGGNIGTASPAADSAGPLYVHKAKIKIQSLSNGKRQVSIEKFFTGVKKNLLNPDELITAILLPLPLKNTKSAFMKMKRGAEDIALVGVTGSHNKDETLLSYTSVAPTPILFDETEFFMNRSHKVSEENFEALWAAIKVKLNPISDVRSSKEYRMHVAEVLTRMIIKEIL